MMFFIRSPIETCQDNGIFQEVVVISPLEDATERLSVLFRAAGKAIDMRYVKSYITLQRQTVSG